MVSEVLRKSPSVCKRCCCKKVAISGGLVVLQECVLPVVWIYSTPTLHSHDFFTKVYRQEKGSLAKTMLSQWVMDTSKNNLYLSNKFVGRCPWSSKNAQFFFIHRHLTDWLMESFLGTCAAVGFQLDLGELGDILLYPIAPYLGKAYEERYCNILIW